MNNEIKKFLEKLASFDEEEPFADLFSGDGDVIVDDYAGGNVDDAFEQGMTRGKWEVRDELAVEATKLLKLLEKERN